MGSPRWPFEFQKWPENKLACRHFSGIENRARAVAGARFSPQTFRFFDTFGLRALDVSLGFLLGALGDSLGLTSGALGGFSVSLGALLASFWMLLRPSYPPIRCSGVLQNGVQTKIASQTSIS